jgi:hypothetical protein
MGLSEADQIAMQAALFAKAANAVQVCDACDMCVCRGDRPLQTGHVPLLEAAGSSANLDNWMGCYLVPAVTMLQQCPAGQHAIFVAFCGCQH